ncbi:hypothetical protein AS361_05710 [Myroides marinus]|uniref:glycosyltransferase n=1 Tax=Myroides marinus TaxID=703342 RepID=UPI000742159B|nr:glycosyltransferase [Myroides marinus]KUF42859.1 hypothetical protein AS361_05710 [Myroides marinus]
MILSVIIPTKNRYSTLLKVVDTILAYDLNNHIEVVIQDNSNNNEEILSYLEDNKEYSNLKYFYCDEKLSVIENSDKAVLNSSGEFVCFIGDDDIVLPNIIEIVQWMKKSNYGIAKCYKPEYYWPGQRCNVLSNNATGVLKFDIKAKKENSIKVLSCELGILKTLKVGGVTMDYLPCLYHGIVNRNILNIIFDKSGTFFPGPSPDMANGTALACITSEYVFFSDPFVISGKSVNSTGGAGVIHKHVNRIEEVSHLPSNTAANWSSGIPKYWTGPTIWAESFLKSLEFMSREDLLGQVNYQYLYAYLTVYNYQSIDVIYKDFRFKKDVTFSYFVCTLFLRRAFNFFKNRLKLNSIEKSGLTDISEAVLCLKNDKVFVNNYDFKVVY